MPSRRRTSLSRQVAGVRGGEEGTDAGFVGAVEVHDAVGFGGGHGAVGAVEEREAVADLDGALGEDPHVPAAAAAGLHLLGESRAARRSARVQHGRRGCVTCTVAVPRRQMSPSCASASLTPETVTFSKKPPSGTSNPSAHHVA